MILFLLPPHVISWKNTTFDSWQKKWIQLLTHQNKPQDINQKLHKIQILRRKCVSFVFFWVCLVFSYIDEDQLDNDTWLIFQKKMWILIRAAKGRKYMQHLEFNILTCCEQTRQASYYNNWLLWNIDLPICRPLWFHLTSNKNCLFKWL